jgi:DedD protein
MDRRVKERLVGASILVVLVVLIVPELLSGPPAPAPTHAGAGLPVSAPEPVRNVTVDLATSKAPTPEQAAEAPASSAEQPQPQPRSADTASAVEGADLSTGDGAPSAAPPPRTPSADSVETTVPAPISVPVAKPAAAGRTWAVQLGSFASRANADKLVHQLKSRGFSVYVAQGGSGPSLRYRVRIGPMADRGAAAQTIAKLKTAGQTASLVPPAP